MGHKVSPIIFRVPYIKNWLSSWYSDKRNYSEFLGLDAGVRDLLKKELKGIPLSNILISRSLDSAIVNVFTGKASLVLGENQENLKRLEALLKKKFNFDFTINVKEVKNQATDAKLVGYSISNQIEKRINYKRAIKMAISTAMEKGAKGIKVKVGGRLNGAEIARKETFKDGNIPTQTIRANIDYTTIRAETVYGTIGIKVWIYKGDIFKK